MREERILKMNDRVQGKGSVVYWMTREQRINYNWGLYFADKLAREHKTFTSVVFCLQPEFLNAGGSHFDFMLTGLKEVERSLQDYNIPFEILFGAPGEIIPEYLKKINAGALITDFDPLRIKRIWKNDVLKKIDIPFYEVDSHNIVPCRFASGKQEYGAYTIRNKITSKLPMFLDEEYILEPQKRFEFPVNDWTTLYSRVAKTTEDKKSLFIPGQSEAENVLNSFVEVRLDKYADERNDPNKDAQSNLSPYFHFGHISSQEAVLAVNKSDVNPESKKVFNEEVIIRKELSDNFCLYNKFYDTVEGFPNWAKESHKKHKLDKRDFVYSIEEFEACRTDEDLWNAAQAELINTGKMHGYMRMYWAKKILEWSDSPEEAMDTAIYLNDKYSIDGRDPNGYAGIAWSIGGVHDRPWFERNVFGQVRYMNREGCKRKFDIKEYILRNKLYKM